MTMKNISWRLNSFVLLGAVLILVGCLTSGEVEPLKDGQGRLRLTVLGPDGAQTPVLVALADATTGKPYVYGRRPLLEGKHKRNKKMPASQRFQWQGKEPRFCDGRLGVDLPPGDYTLDVGKGIEFTPQKMAFSITAGKVNKIKMQLERFVDFPSRGWWAGDDHFHFRREDTSMDDYLMMTAAAEDVAIVNVLQMGSFLSGDAFRQFAWGADGRNSNGKQVLVPGQEEPRTGMLGHVIGLNVQSYVRHLDQYFHYDRVFKPLRAQGALTGYAHVRGYTKDGAGNLINHKGVVIDQENCAVAWTPFNCDQGLTVDLAEGLVDFVEIIDSRNTLNPSVYYEFLNLGFHITASAGSDFPYGAGHVAEQRVYVN
ncbi:CehA/McbA family metallohydrolase, partial [Candidatus Hydrogenedentota bacterium]